VNHKRKILHSTTGHPGRWNDKTLVRFDHFMDDLRNGAFDETMKFELQTSSGETINMCGAYVIVDNGYLSWSTTVPPMKNSSYRSEIRFSQWLESLRKDVECTFGILKGRWRILKSGIRLHNTAAADNIWLTCCALHNMLLEVDGLDKGWKTGVLSHWQLESGQFGTEDVPEAIRRLINPNGTNESGWQNYDRTKFGYCSRVEEEEAHDYDDNDYSSTIREGGRVAGNIDTVRTSGAWPETNQHEVGTKRPIAVNDLCLKRFRSMLIEHFNASFHQHQLVWPKRLTTKPRHVPNNVLQY
jgi:hypothetical protein